MTEESLKWGIQRLIKKRMDLPHFSPEIDEIGKKLEKLYELQWIMNQQRRA